MKWIKFLEFVLRKKKILSKLELLEVV